MATERLSLRIDTDLKKSLAWEAGEGAFTSQEAMDAWVASWGSESELPPPEPDIQIALIDR